MNGLWRSGRVILTSAYNQEVIADAMRPPQVRSFIRKPFQLDELLNAIGLKPRPARSAVRYRSPLPVEIRL
jgi:hypothetical protein